MVVVFCLIGNGVGNCRIGVGMKRKALDHSKVYDTIEPLFSRVKQYLAEDLRTYLEYHLEHTTLASIRDALKTRTELCFDKNEAVRDACDEEICLANNATTACRLSKQALDARHLLEAQAKIATGGLKLPKLTTTTQAPQKTIPTTTTITTTTITLEKSCSELETEREEAAFIEPEANALEEQRRIIALARAKNRAEACAWADSILARSILPI